MKYDITVLVACLCDLWSLGVTQSVVIHCHLFKELPSDVTNTINPLGVGGCFTEVFAEHAESNAVFYSDLPKADNFHTLTHFLGVNKKIKNKHTHILCFFSLLI